MQVWGWPYHLPIIICLKWTLLRLICWGLFEFSWACETAKLVWIRKEWEDTPRPGPGSAWSLPGRAIPAWAHGLGPEPGGGGIVSHSIVSYRIV